MPDRSQRIAKPSSAEIERAAALHPVGAVVEATVAGVFSFGLVLDLPDAPRAAFLNHLNLDPEGRPRPAHARAVPAEGESLRVVVLAHEPERHQIAVRVVEPYCGG